VLFESFAVLDGEGTTKDLIDLRDAPYYFRDGVGWRKRRQDEVAGL